MSKLVSILIPCYNAALHLDQCIQSALNQTYENKEIILIDDGSIDNSYDIAKQYPITIYRQNNTGQAYTRNKLLEHAKGEYIQLLDADDYLEINKISDQLNNNYADVYIDYWKLLYDKTIYNKIYINFKPLDLLLLGIKTQTNCFLLNSKIFNNIKFRNSICQDSFLLLDIVKNKYSILFTKKYSSTYRCNWSINQITNNNSNRVVVYKTIIEEVKELKKQNEYLEYNNLVDINSR